MFKGLKIYLHQLFFLFLSKTDEIIKELDEVMGFELHSCLLRYSRLSYKSFLGILKTGILPFFSIGC